jgi:hypothetical protein
MARRVITIRSILLGDSNYLNEHDLLSLMEDRLSVACTMEARLMLTHLLTQLKEAHEEEIRVRSLRREVEEMAMDPAD